MVNRPPKQQMVRNQSRRLVKKKAQRPKLEQAVGFIHGGELKASRIFAFAVTDGSDVESVKNYVKDNLVTYFGPVLSGRYVKCEDANETLATILDSAGEDRIENCTIIKRNVQNAAILYRDSIGNGVTHTFSLSDEKAKTGKKTTGAKTKPKGGAKKVTKNTNASPEEDDTGDVDDQTAREEEGGETGGEGEVEVDENGDADGEENNNAEDGNDGDVNVSDEDEAEIEQAEETPRSKTNNKTKSGNAK